MRFAVAFLSLMLMSNFAFAKDTVGSIMAVCKIMLEVKNLQMQPSVRSFL